MYGTKAAAQPCSTAFVPFLFPTLCGAIFRAPKGRIYKICFMCSNFHSIFRTYFAIANIFQHPVFLPIANYARMRKRSAFAHIFCVAEFVRLFSVIHSAFLHVFPYNFVVTVLQHIQTRTNCLNLCKIFPQSLLDTGLSYFSIMHKSFCLSSYVLTQVDFLYIQLKQYLFVFMIYTLFWIFF